MNKCPNCGSSTVAKENKITWIFGSDVIRNYCRYCAPARTSST